MNKKLIKKSHSSFNISYHIVFCSKYRKRYLNYFEPYIIKCMNDKAKQLSFNIENIQIMPDHVHMFIRCSNNSINIHKIIQSLKGYTSYKIRKQFKFLKKYKSFWSTGYFIESIGSISEKSIKKYIDNQKN